jgi:hypothetical protein
LCEKLETFEIAEKIQYDLHVQTHLRNLHNMNPLPENHFNYLIKLKKEGFEPKVIYDIGSCVLHWTNQAKKLWPDAKYILFDAFAPAEFLYKEYGYDYIVMRKPKAIAEKKIATKAMSKVGLTAYDFEGLLLKQPIELLTGKWHKKPSNHEQDKMYCSEFVSWVYGLNDSYRMSPKDFLDFCKDNGWDEIHNTGITL